MDYNQHNQHTHHSSNSIDNAAYPADSSYSPAGQHPSASISNAAYPADSSYSPAGHHPSGSLSNAAYPADSSYSPAGHHPSGSLSNAAYPADSSYSPAGHHASGSLSNAAYPQDSSYRPSAPTTRSDDKLAMPEARYSQSYNSGPSVRQAPAAAAPYPTYPASTQPPFQHISPPGVRVQANDPLYSPTSKPISPWTPDGMSAAHPNLPPPPPYDPSRPGTGTSPSTPREPVSPIPSEHAPLNNQPQQHQRQQSLHQQNNVARPGSNYSSMPPQTPAPAAAHVASPHSPAAQDLSAQERGLAGEQPRAYLQSMTGGMPAYGNQPGTLGPVAKERKRRKQKLGILAAVLCAVLLFLIALIVGILVGVVKINAKDDKPPPPPPRW